MSTPENIRKELLQELEYLYSQFNLSLDDLESEKGEAFSHKIKEILSKLTSIKEKLRADYSSSLDSRFDHLEKNSPALTNLEENYSEKLVIQKLEHIEKQIFGLKKEVKHLYPKPPIVLSLKYWARKKEIWVLVAASILLGLFFVISAMLPLKSGLKGEYFSNLQLSKLYKSRVDKSINFDWGTNSPMRGMKPDMFSVRWTGFLKTPQDGEYEFSIHSDDGVRLMIDETLLLQNWTVHSLTVNTATMTLTQGDHKIKVEYFENKKRAVIKLFWKKPGDIQPKIISSEFLVPDDKYLVNNERH